MAAIIHFLSDRGDLLYGGCSVHASPSLPVSTHMYTRAPPFTRFSPLLAHYFLLLFPSLSSTRVDSVSSIRFLVFVTVQGDPIAREFAHRE